jgi:hypothetical protein
VGIVMEGVVQIIDIGCRGLVSSYFLTLSGFIDLELKFMFIRRVNAYHHRDLLDHLRLQLGGNCSARMGWKRMP